MNRTKRRDGALDEGCQGDVLKAMQSAVAFTSVAVGEAQTFWLYLFLRLIFPYQLHNKKKTVLLSCYWIEMLEVETSEVPRPGTHAPRVRVPSRG